MRMSILFGFFGAISAFALFSPLQADTLATDTDHKEVQIPSEFGYTNDALYFPGNPPKSNSKNIAVVLVHQYSSHKESWIEFAQKLQTKGITSLSIEDVGRRDVLDAIKFLASKDYHKVMLVGASMGGGSVLQASAQSEGKVEKVVLLSTTSATAITDPKIAKLFVVAKSDMWGSDSYSVFEETSDPKNIIEYDGFAHGQDLLTGEYGKEVTTLIIDFLMTP